MISLKLRNRLYCSLTSKTGYRTLYISEQEDNCLRIYVYCWENIKKMIRKMCCQIFHSHTYLHIVSLSLVTLFIYIYLFIYYIVLDAKLIFNRFIAWQNGWLIHLHDKAEFFQWLAVVVFQKIIVWCSLLIISNYAMTYFVCVCVCVHAFVCTCTCEFECAYTFNIQK